MGAGRSDCPGAGAEPGSASYRTLSSATVCLLNRERRQRGEHPLGVDRRLGRAATAYARDMSAHGYFSHTSPTGQDPGQRIAHQRYRCRTSRCPLGENLAMSTKPASPQVVVGMWMHSPDHRSNILYGGFRTIGLGVTPERGNEEPAIYVTEFGG